MVRQKKDDDILELLREEGAEAARKAQRGLIIQPGAIGDCILTLPLASFMKEAFGLGAVDILGHAEYIEYLPGRSCIDRISSIDSVHMHRLFVEQGRFDLADRDHLISAFAGYAWIVTFLGEPNSDFEQNLVYTANCSGSCEVLTLPIKAPKGYARHLTVFYAEQLIAQASTEQAPHIRPSETLISAGSTDVAEGRRLLEEAGLDPDRRPIVVQPGSGGEKKCWHLDNFLAVAEALKANGLQIAFLLGPAEVERLSKEQRSKLGNSVSCLRALSLVQVLGVLSCAGAFVGNDSGITHVAASLGVRTFALFGPTDASLYGPIGPEVTILSKNPRTFASKPSARSQKELVTAILA